MASMSSSNESPPNRRSRSSAEGSPTGNVPPVWPVTGSMMPSLVLDLPYASLQHVTYAAHCADGCAGALGAEFRPDPRDVGVDHVRAGVEVHVPDFLEQGGAGHHRAGLEHEVLEEAELAWGEWELAPGDEGLVARPVETHPA